MTSSVISDSFYMSNVSDHERVIFSTSTLSKKRTEKLLGKTKSM